MVTNSLIHTPFYLRLFGSGSAQQARKLQGQPRFRVYTSALELVLEPRILRPAKQGLELNPGVFLRNGPLGWHGCSTPSFSEAGRIQGQKARRLEV